MKWENSSFIKQILWFHLTIVQREDIKLFLIIIKLSSSNKNYVRLQQERRLTIDLSNYELK